VLYGGRKNSHQPNLFSRLRFPPPGAMRHNTWVIIFSF